MPLSGGPGAVNVVTEYARCAIEDVFTNKFPQILAKVFRQQSVEDGVKAAVEVEHEIDERRQKHVTK